MLKSLEKDPIISETRIWLSMALTLVPMLVLFFKPTWIEFLAFYLIDMAAYLVCQHTDIRIFRRFWPRSRLFFPTLDPTLLQFKSLDEKKTIYQNMLSFPRDRALFIGTVSGIKVIPSFIFVLTVWRGEDPLWMAFLKGLCICAFTFSFLIGMSYLGYHNRISTLLQEVHEQADWSDVFKDVDLTTHHKLFQRFEIMSACSVWAFWTFAIALIVTTPDIPTWQAVLQTIIMSGAGLYFMAQLVMTSRRQIMKGLQDVVVFHAQASELNRSKGLALSTNPTLAFYQRTLNDLIDKNAENEKEIHRWILRQAEDSRYLQLGRLTGLLVHDLLTPLTVMRYSLAVLDEQNAFQQEQNKSYAERLRFSLDQTTDFIKNIRSSIRDQSSGYREASLSLAHQSALKMVSYLYDNRKFSAIAMHCDLDPDLKASIPQPELNQVLLNLYSNAVKNLIDHQIAEPRLSIQVVDDASEQFTLVIKDNGTGLSAETFHYITEEAERLPGQEGIGLKLTKRLIELYGGALQLVQPTNKVGCEFHLTLRKPQKIEARRPLLSGRTPAPV
ncbi:MAG: HAMP domain-containing histidine kinase, partial [Pseudobdellovibrionaceae bacterium]|nr:HAMP domain-containing histidine kinase [Pseudobdellovibrionaceae bacterium]